MEELKSILKSLQQLHPFTELQVYQVTEHLSWQTLLKKDCLLKPGQVCTSISFVVSGSLRFYTLTDEGELTINFFTENQWLADLESLMGQKPSKNYLEAMENTNLATIALKDIHQLVKIDPKFIMLNALVAKLAIPSSHLSTLQTKSPDERYKELLEKHPAWVNRFPQKQIASFLGITPETLSRVRARIS
jgi:CRP/FNR family transcriptional regulator, anaerobic regulatory protein